MSSVAARSPSKRRWFCVIPVAVCHLIACNPWLTPEPPPPQPGAPDCAAYCERLEQCEPATYYDACERDCEVLRVDLEAQRVSGLTDELIACWGSSRTCEQARACDGGEW